MKHRETIDPAGGSTRRRPRPGGVILPLIALLWAGGCSTDGDSSKRAAGAPKSLNGNVFNLRILSDSTPDWSSRENFVRSALSGWETDREKAIAQFRWSYLSRRVGGFVVEDAQPVYDPVLFFNSYGITQCSMISAINVGLWEAAGYDGRTVNIFEHVVAEVKYGGRWHLFDNDFCNYFLSEDGDVAGGQELYEGRKRQPGKYYVFDHCPTASSPGGRIYMGPSSWKLDEVARDWYQVFHPREGHTCAQAGHRCVLSVRSNESYIRYWRPTGQGLLFSRPLNNGKDPATPDGSPLMNNRSNGHWIWKPDLSDPGVLHAADHVRCGPEGLRLEDGRRDGTATFHIMAANVITAVRLAAKSKGRVSFSVSGNGGISWAPVKIESKPGGVDEGIADEAVAGRLDVLLRAELAADGSLNSLEINTITQVNPRTLPALRLGKNRIVAVSDEHLEYLVLHPRLTGDQHVREVHRASGWQSLSKPGWTEPSIRAADKGELVLLAQAPRPIRKIRMACTAQLVEPAGALAMDVSYDDGKTWRELGKFPFRGAPYDIRPSAATVSVPANVHKALLRYAVTGSGNGLVNVVAEAGFEPAKPRNPCDITYRWEEYRDGTWTKRAHTERISEGYQSYVINVGGSRPPRMNSLEVGPAGTGKPGYSDGVKDPPVTARPDVTLVYGRPISVGSKYTVNREAGAAFPDVGSGLLTDGYVGLAGYWALDNINLSGRKNEKRVGELVVWEPGEELVVTVDLGQSRKVGGARVCAVQPNARVLYPARMIVEVSPDGNNFASAGEVGWEECFFPSADFLPWEGVDSPLYDHLPAGGMTDFKFPVVFHAPVEARYVRFRLKPPADAHAGIGLWEVEVYDGIKREPWSNRIVLPRPPSAPST